MAFFSLSISLYIYISYFSLFYFSPCLPSIFSPCSFEMVPISSPFFSIFFFFGFEGRNFAVNLCRVSANWLKHRPSIKLLNPIDSFYDHWLSHPSYRWIYIAYIWYFSLVLSIGDVFFTAVVAAVFDIFTWRWTIDWKVRPSIRIRRPRSAKTK